MSTKTPMRIRACTAMRGILRRKLSRTSVGKSTRPIVYFSKVEGNEPPISRRARQPALSKRAIFPWAICISSGHATAAELYDPAFPVRAVSALAIHLCSCGPGSNPGNIPGDRHVAQKAQLWAGRTRSKSQVSPVSSWNGSRSPLVRSSWSVCRIYNASGSSNRVLERTPDRLR